MPAARSVKYGCTNCANDWLAPRLSLGVPLRYLPVSTPRPNGDHASSPSPSRIAAGTASRSTPRLSSEYSTWLLAITTRPGRACCQAAA